MDKIFEELEYEVLAQGIFENDQEKEERAKQKEEYKKKLADIDERRKKLDDEFEQDLPVLKLRENMAYYRLLAKNDSSYQDKLKELEKDYDNMMRERFKKSLARDTGEKIKDSVGNKKGFSKWLNIALDSAEYALTTANKENFEHEFQKWSKKEEQRIESQNDKYRDECAKLNTEEWGVRIDRTKQVTKNAWSDIKSFFKKQVKDNPEEAEKNKKQIEKVQNALDNTGKTTSNSKSKDDSGDDKEGTKEYQVMHNGKKTTLVGRPKKVGSGRTYFFKNDPNGPTVPEKDAKEMIKKSGVKEGLSLKEYLVQLIMQ